VTPTNTPTRTPTTTPGVSGASLFTVAPCRLADTRDADGPSGGPALAANTVRTFPVANLCGIPTSATAVAINLAVFLPSDGGDLRVYPAGGVAPLASSINFRPDIVRANNAIIRLGAGGQISIQCDMPSGSTNVFFDVYGYFE
jgi:serine protease